MRLHYFFLKGFRRIREAKFFCGDATFLIGENNIGKSSVLKALDIFFSETTKLEDQDFFRVDEANHFAEEVVMEVKFSELADESHQWRGFKGRVFVEEINGRSVNCIYYKKTFPKGGQVKREMRVFNKSIKSEYSGCKSINDFIEASVSDDVLSKIFGDMPKDKAIPGKEKDKLDLISEIWDVDETSNDWQTNPGGIEGNISIKLPKFLLIPAENRKEEIDSKTGTLQKTMIELFEEVRDQSANYRKALQLLW